MAKPTLKWAGGKRDLFDEIKDRFPSNYSSYHEPFFGGGALFFHLEPTNGSINDKNSRLINYYTILRDRKDELIEELEKFDDPESDPDPNREFSSTDRKGRDIDEYYYQMRTLYNRRPNGESYDPVEEAALLQYLNRTCYNGLYRENNDGEFNTPIGRYSNPDWILEKRLHEASEVLEGSDIHNKDFEYILDVVDKGDLVYFDPPYEPLSPTANFTEYSAGGFDKDAQMRLIEVVKQLDDMEVNFVLSNSAIMHDEYVDIFEVDYVMGGRSISRDGDDRGDTKEILVSNN